MNINEQRSAFIVFTLRGGDLEMLLSLRAWMKIISETVFFFLSFVNLCKDKQIP